MTNENLWIDYDKVLTKIFINTQLFSTKNIETEFISFVSKFKTKILHNKKNEKIKNNNAEIWYNDYGVPIGPFNKQFLQQIIFSKNLINPFEFRDIPKLAVEQFYFIVSQYFKFLNDKKFKKLKSLKKNQELLPIANLRQKICDYLKENQVLIIAGDTGCGKSTQLPQYLLKSTLYNKICCTQPRRLACTALARRVACETLKEFSTEIAFQTRFDKTKTSATKLLFLTEGVLLRQMSTDPDLMQYDVIILDEVHERNVSGDLLVALLQNVCYRRPTLKLILMSATINTDLFSSFFSEAPIITVPGRLYPIDLKYMPVKLSDLELEKRAQKIDCGPYLNILQLIDTKYSLKERGDVLIFLNGISEISILADALKEYAEYTKKWIILILHSTLSVEEQNKVFDLAPPDVRKCILSTNIAETSVTIDGIRFVIDSGKENLLCYDFSTRMHRLTQTWISKASANQRKGRAGRTGPGVCFRLYSEEDFEKMDDFTLPEIKRISLESLIMQILDMNLQIDVRDFNFIERPDTRSLNNAIESLKAHGIINQKSEKELTPIGMILAKLPVELPIGKMLINACVLDQVDVILTIAAGLSVQSPFTNRSFRDYECIENRQNLLSDLGDPFTLIKIYREWLIQRLEGKDTSKWCRKCGIEEARLYEIVKLRRQLRSILEDNQLIPNFEKKYELEAMSSKERRIKLGMKRKLHELKKKAGYENRKSKILKKGHHFDTIMDEKIDYNENQDKKNLTTDINCLEFSMLVDNNVLHREIKSHKLNDETATLLKIIISSSCYPQYAILDTANSFSLGSDLFAHTSTKPFVVIHPNSALALLPEYLQSNEDNKSQSVSHQLIFYSLLLETTKCYLCNTSRIPAMFLLLSASNIKVISSSLCCDEYISFTFNNEKECFEMLKTVYNIKKLIFFSIKNKLNHDEYYDSKDLQKKIIDFSKLNISYSMRKVFDPPKIIKCGIFLANGEEHPLLKCDFEESVENDDLNEKNQLNKTININELDKNQLHSKKYFCEVCNKTMWFSNNIDIIRHKKEHKMNTE